MSAEDSLRLNFELPPGASLSWHVDHAPGGVMALPLWQYWARLAREHAATADAAREPDRVVDARSRALAARDGSSLDDHLVGEPWHPAEGIAEFDGSLVAMVAAALAIDGFYGSMVQLVNAPPSDAPRHRRIIEALKLGFFVGGESHAWLPEIEWLFRARDVAVHHREEPRPPRISRVTGETVIVSSEEAALFTAPNSQRAAALATTIIDTCLAKPKAATRAWVAARDKATLPPPGALP